MRLWLPGVLLCSLAAQPAEGQVTALEPASGVARVSNPRCAPSPPIRLGTWVSWRGALRLARLAPADGPQILPGASPPRLSGVEADGGGPKFSGAVFTRFRGRNTSRESDQDAFFGMLLKIEPTQGVELFFKGDLFVDVGRKASSESRLDDVWDTWSSSVQGRGQEAYLRFDLGVKGLDVRVGRQLRFAPESLQFDGVSASLQLAEWLTVRGLGGIPVYFYKSPWRGDALAGGGIDVTPSAWTKLSLDYLHTTENAQGRTGFLHDDLFVLSARQRLTESVVLRARGEVLDDEVRAAEGHVSVVVRSLDLKLRGRYYALFKRQEDLTNSLDPFSEVLTPENAHQSVHVSLWKGFGDVVGVELFYSLRQVGKERNENLWNKDYQRYGGALHLYDVPFPGLSLSVTWESWDVEDRRGSDIRQMSGELVWRPLKAFRLSGGSSYMLYKFDRDLKRIREDVRLFFARVRLQVDDHRFDLGYEFEHDDIEDFHTVRVGYRHEF